MLVSVFAHGVGTRWGEFQSTKYYCVLPQMIQQNFIISKGTWDPTARGHYPESGEAEWSISRSALWPRFCRVGRRQTEQTHFHVNIIHHGHRTCGCGASGYRGLIALFPLLSRLLINCELLKTGEFISFTWHLLPPSRLPLYFQTILTRS